MKALLLRAFRILAWIIVGFVTYSVIHIVCFMCGLSDLITWAIILALWIALRFFLRAWKRKKDSN
jgi:hypothetical protein